METTADFVLKQNFVRQEAANNHRESSPSSVGIFQEDGEFFAERKLKGPDNGHVQ